MAAPDLYEAVMTFLDGDSGDVRAGVNNEIANALAAGSVNTARQPVGAGPRRTNPQTRGVEIVPVAPPDARQIGIDAVEQDVVVDLVCYRHLKDVAAGDKLLDAVEDMARVLRNRYHRRATFTISATGATFRRAAARITEMDTDPEAGDWAAAVVRCEFTFSHKLETNTV